MKKIITAAAVAAMAASFAAAEVKVSVNYRTGIQALEHTLGKRTTLLSNVTKNRSTSDALTFKGSAEYGGIELEIDPISATGTDSKSGSFSKSLSLEKYNAWINFGNFTVKSGAWDARAVGRVTNDIGNHEGKFWGEINKPGLGATNKGVGLGTDISQQNGKKTQTTMVQYNNKDLGLEARVAYLDKDGATTTFAGENEKITNSDKSYSIYYDGVKTDYNSKGTSTGSSNSKGYDWVFANETWFGELGYTVKGVGRILATTKIAHKDYAGAIFLEPKLDSLPALTSLIGFTAETNTAAATDKSGDDVAASAFAVDFRARYNLGDFVEGLSATVMYNWTFGNATKADTNLAGESVSTDDGKPGYYSTWAMLNLTYKLNDTFTPFLSLGFSNATSCGSAGKAALFDDKFTCSLRTYAGVEIYNTKNANIITGVCWDANNMTNAKANSDKGTAVYGKCVKTVSIPVLFRVKF